MRIKKSLGIAVLLLSTGASGLDRPTPQVQIETKIVEVGPGVISADFGLNFGHVYANFPSDFAPGDRISGTLAVVPNGKNDAQRSANAVPLRTVGVEICGSTVSVTSSFFVCPRVSPERMEVQLIVGIKPIDRLFVEPEAEVPGNQPAFILPVAGIEPGRARVLGPFGGELSGTSIRVGDAVAHLVAESPRSCIFDVPAGPPGLTRIELSENGSRIAGVFRRIGLALTPPRPIIHTGDTTSFSAEVTGLAGLERPLTLNLRNLSTAVVAMEGGDEQTLTIRPSEVTAAGSFAISRRLTGKGRGDYAVNVSLPWDEPAVAAR